jgi:Rrf2 family protein
MIDMAKHGGNGPIKRRDIAKRENIPIHYLENILVTLRRAGLIRTTRGASGGYVLGRKADEIKALEIILALEGSIAPVECVDNPSTCKRIRSCQTYTLWQSLYRAQKTVLESQSLKDLAAVRREEWVI